MVSSHRFADRIDFCSNNSEQASGATTPQGESSPESILSIVGGEESFKILIEWAKQNLSEEELMRLAEILESENIELIKSTLVKLMNRFNQSQSYQNYRLF